MGEGCPARPLPLRDLATHLNTAAGASGTGQPRRTGGLGGAGKRQGAGWWQCGLELGALAASPASSSAKAGAMVGS